MAGIGTDLHPFVEVRFTDAQGRALDRTGMSTEGAIDVGFPAAPLPTEVRTDGTAVLTSDLNGQPMVNSTWRRTVAKQGEVVIVSG